MYSRGSSLGEMCAEHDTSTQATSRAMVDGVLALPEVQNCLRSQIESQLTILLRPVSCLSLLDSAVVRIGGF